MKRIGYLFIAAAMGLSSAAFAAEAPATSAATSAKVSTGKTVHYQRHKKAAEQKAQAAKKHHKKGPQQKAQAAKKQHKTPPATPAA